MIEITETTEGLYLEVGPSDDLRSIFIGWDELPSVLAKLSQYAQNRGV